MTDLPRRIVSLVPSHTESLHDLGLAERVVGRTRFCIHPAPWVETIPAVGGTKDAKLDKILALRPDLVVADKDENPKALVEALEAEGVEVLWSAIDSVEDVADFLERLGARCGVPDGGRMAAEAIRAALDEVHTPPGGSGAKPTQEVPVWCPIWFDPWMTFDRTAYPHAVLEAVGLRNVFADHDGPKYFQVTAAEVAASGAASTLLPTEPYPFHKRHHTADLRDALASLGPSGEPAQVHLIDGEALTWFGTRTAPGLRELAKVAARLRTSP
jgi:ABC-type Fe3+-hydroxamate transport system substrate-binding protein